MSFKHSRKLCIFSKGVLIKNSKFLLRLLFFEKGLDTLFVDVVYTNRPRQYTDAVYLDTIISPYETNTSNSHAEREEITALSYPQYFFLYTRGLLLPEHAPGARSGSKAPPYVSAIS